MCIEHLAAGNPEMAECARTVRDVLALCEASKVLIGARSPFTKEQLVLCRNACEACRKACEEHAPHHAECRACGQACVAAIAAINLVLA